MKTGGARSVESAERVHQGREAFGFGEMVEVVRIVAQVYKVDLGILRIGPGDDEYGVVMRTFCGPFGEHLLLS